ncbi:MAG: glycosyltransferase family 2 protein [Thermoleophilaceae bacterium]
MADGARSQTAEGPRLSVIMAARDAEETIREAVESALAQSEPRIELIVVDDGSRLHVADALSGVDDERLRIIRHARSRGLSVARNTGLRHVRAPFLAPLDADDGWERDYAATVLERFGDPNVGLVYANVRLRGHPAGQELYIEDPTVHPMDRFPRFAEGNPVPNLAATMRTEAVRQAGGWATWLRQVMDYQLYSKLIMAGWRFDYVNRPLGWYRWPEPERGMSWDRRQTELDELKMWIAFVARHPLVRGPRRQVRLRLGRELRRLAQRRR